MNLRFLLACVSLGGLACAGTQGAPGEPAHQAITATVSAGSSLEATARIARYLVDGTLDWAKRFNPGPDAERFELAAIAANADGSYAVCGAFEGTINLSLVDDGTATFTASPDIDQLIVTKICL